MTPKARLFASVLATGFLLLVACRKSPVPQIQIVAQVEDHYLTSDQLLSWMPPNLPEEQKNAVARQYIDRWVQKTILAISANKEGITLTPYQKWSVRNLEKEMLAQKYIEAKLPKEIIITDEEISNYYEENKAEFIRDMDEVHLVQLYLENLDQAIAREIRESKSLLDVIQKNYLDTKANRMLEQNGDLGYVPVQNLRKEIIWTIKNGATGRIYGPIRIDRGYYYFQMMDRQPKGTYRSLDLVKEDIRLRLMNIRRNKLVADIAKKDEEKLSVSVYPDHIK